MNDNNTLIADQLQRGRRLKSREVTSPNQALSSSSTNRSFETLADHLKDECFKYHISVNSNASLNKQKTSTKFSTFEPQICAKENNRTIIGGSLRYTGRLNLEEKSVSSSKQPIQTSNYGRLSVDENALFGSRRKSDKFKNSIEIESDYSSPSPVLWQTSTVNSRKSGIVVSSKYMNYDVQRKTQRGSSDSNISNPISFESSPKAKKNLIKNVFQRANSLSAHGSSMTQWALSPGRSGSPSMSVENKEKPMSFSSLRPAKTPSKAIKMEKLLNLGFDLFKSKKASISSTSPAGPDITDNVHQLRMLHNRFIQWQFVNAKAHAASENLTHLTERNLLCAWSTIVKLQQSVLQKKLHLHKEKMEFKLNFILLSQLKPLEAWRDMERQHMTALSMTKECLHSVICRVPLIEGAKIDAQAISIALRHASDLAVSIKSMLTLFTPRAKETASMLSELAKVVAQEKMLLEESFELHRTISALEMEERSLKCGIVQMAMQQHHQQLQQSQEASIIT